MNYWKLLFHDRITISGPLCLILFALTLSACKRESCLDKNYGDEFLEQITKTYEVFDSANILVFKDMDGNEHNYLLETDFESLRNNIYPDSCEGEQITIQHRSEYLLRRFVAANNTSIAIVRLVGFLDGEQELEEDRIVDIVKLSVFDDNNPSVHLSRICIMTSSRDGELDRPAFNQNEFIEHDSLTLLGKTFHNVYEQRNGTTKLFYSPAEGVVSIVDNLGRQLVLDHVE